MRRTLLALAGAGSLALGLASAAPAFAGGTPPDCATAPCPVTATIQIPASVTLTGLSANITFPDTPAGNTATATAAESYTVSTNDPSGYTLNLESGVGNQFAASTGPAVIPNSDLTVTETGAFPGKLAAWPAGQTGVVIASPPSPTSGDNFSENWALALPNGQASGAFHETFQYLAVGN